jgi:hypothetical protein
VTSAPPAVLRGWLVACCALVVAGAGAGACQGKGREPAAIGATATASAPQDARAPFRSMAERSKARVWQLENAFVLTEGAFDEAPRRAWTLVDAGGMRETKAFDPGDLTSAPKERRTLESAWLGRWPDHVWALRAWHVEFEDTWGTELYRGVAGAWRRTPRGDGGHAFAIWEAKKGCWMSLRGNNEVRVPGRSTALFVDGVDCPGAPRGSTFWTADDGNKVAAVRAFRDGGVAVVQQHLDDGSFAPTPASSSVPKLSVWAPDALSSTAKTTKVPTPTPDAAWQIGEVELGGCSSRDFVMLVTVEQGKTGGRAETRLLSCSPDGCRSTDLRFERMPSTVCLADDALLVVEPIRDGGRIWGRRRGGAFEEVAAPLQGAVSGAVQGLFGRSPADVWLAVTDGEQTRVVTNRR